LCTLAIAIAAVIACGHPSRLGAQEVTPTPKNWLEFKQINPADSKSFELVPVPAVPGSITGSVQADRLIRSAFDAMERKDLDTAQGTLDKAKTINPEQLGLWSVYGLVAVQRKSYAEAVDDLQRELSLHVGQTRLYALLTALEQKLGRHQEMVDSYRAWAASGTTNPWVPAYLMELLIGDGDVPGALLVGHRAQECLPESAKKDVEFRLALAYTQLSSGETNEGNAALESVLKEADVAKLNDIAFDLANNSLDLALAEQCVRAALDRLAEESNTWTIEADTSIQQEKSRAIVAMWDTLGWTLFREGKLEEAQSYLQAAWLWQTNLDTGKHFGDVLAARGDKSGALTTYEIALASVPPVQSIDTRTDTSLTGTDVTARVDALRHEGAQPTASSLQSAMTSMRVTPLVPAKGLKGEAEYCLLLKGGRVVSIEQRGSRSIGGVEGRLRQADVGRYFPSGSDSSLIRNAHVNCHSGVCGLTFEP
jgi:tetratricopeptide (TPR) repeat protein